MCGRMNMKRWINTVLAALCVWLPAAGCQGGRKETAKPVSEPVKAVKAAPVAPPPAETAAPARQSIAASAEPQAPQSTSQQPKIKFENTVYDIKEMKPDSWNFGYYRFTNVGKVPVKILHIKKDCGCTPFELDKREYAPGESGVIKVKYHAGPRGVRILKHLYVTTDDPNNQRVQITFKGEVVIKVTVEPRMLHLSLGGGDVNVPAITISSKDGQAFSIKSIESTGNAITADFDPNASAKEFIISPRVDREKLGSNPNGLIRFHITHPDVDTVAVGYMTSAEFSTQPAAIVIRDAVPLKSEERQLSVKSNYDKPFEIESIWSRKGYIKSVKQDKEGNKYKLTLEITPPKVEDAQVFSDILIIQCKDGGTIEVNCRGYFRGNK
jgi:hypothetical protein